MEDSTQLVEPVIVTLKPVLPMNTLTTWAAALGMDLPKFKMRALYTARRLKVKQLRCKPRGSLAS